MNLDEAHKFTKAYAAQIVQRIGLGDKLALRVFTTCGEFIKDQRNVLKQTEFIKVAEEYSRRNLTITEHADLDRLFGGQEGYKEERKIIVPVGTKTP